MILIFTCFISKQCGVHSLRKIIKEISASMHIIGRISEDSHTRLNTIIHNVQVGKQRKIQRLIKTGENLSIDVDIAMVGKS